MLRTPKFCLAPDPRMETLTSRGPLPCRAVSPGAASTSSLSEKARLFSMSSRSTLPIARPAGFRSILVPRTSTGASTAASSFSAAAASDAGSGSAADPPSRSFSACWIFFTCSIVTFNCSVNCCRCRALSGATGDAPAARSCAKTAWIIERKPTKTSTITDIAGPIFFLRNKHTLRIRSSRLRATGAREFPKFNHALHRFTCRPPPGFGSGPRPGDCPIHAAPPPGLSVFRPFR